MKGIQKTLAKILVFAMLASLMVVPALGAAGEVESTVTLAEGNDTITLTIAAQKGTWVAYSAANFTIKDATSGSPATITATGGVVSGSNLILTLTVPAATAANAGAWTITIAAAAFTGAETETADITPVASTVGANDATTPTGINTDNVPYTLTAASAAVQGDTAAAKVTETLPDATGFIIDLAKETLTIPETFKVAAYSLDGGAKWKTGAIGSKEGADISKLLNKGMTLLLTDSYDKKNKEATKGVVEVAEAKDTDGNVTTEKVVGVKAATLITFPAIEARPAATKLVVNYALGEDTSGKTNGKWKLSEKDSDTVADIFATVQAVIPDDGKKYNAVKDKWGKFDAAGVPVKDMKDGKVQKTTYLYRTAPVVGATNTPASKAMKVTAASVGKAPALKPDYKKETLKTKKDIMLYFGPRDAKAAGVTSTATLSDVAVNAFITDKNAAATKFFGPVDASDKEPILLGDYLSEEATYVTVWIGATAKKPATMKQEITLAPRAYLANSVIAGSKGKIEIGVMEIKVSDEKFGKVPKGTSDYSGKIRVKSTAKAAKADKAKATLAYEGAAASKLGDVEIKYGEYEAPKKEGANGKNGYLSASVIAPAYKGRIALIRPKLVFNSVSEGSSWGVPTADQLKTLAYGLATADAAKFGVQFEVVSGDDLADTKEVETALVELGFIDSVTAALTAEETTDDNTFGIPVYDEPVTTGTVAPAKLTIPLATIASAGTVKLAIDDLATELAAEGALKDYAAKDQFYMAPFSFDIAKAIVAPAFTPNAGAVTDGKLTIADLTEAKTVTATVTLGETPLTLGDDYTVSFAPATITGGTVALGDAANANVATITPTTTNAAAQTVTIKVTLTAAAAKNYVIADGKDSCAVTITKITFTAPPTP